jgi:heterodisulfide reductase subunit B2
MNSLRFGYFPGCSLEHNAAAYHKSTMAIARPLGIEFEEVEDWNCCGATEYISLNMMASMALVARNLAQAAKGNGQHPLVAPCSACYLNLRKCDYYMQVNPELADRVNTALAAGGLSYQAGTIKVRHLVDVLHTDIGCEGIASRVTRPLAGLRVAPYYGCLISRPRLGPGEQDTEYPTVLDELLASIGATVVDFPQKTHCCGGHMTQISEGTGFEMIRRLVKGATDAGADAIVTLCPMCQLNLDAFQGGMNRYFKTSYHVPVLYFTQVIGLAFGMSAQEVEIGSELVDARPALAKIGVELPPAPEPAPKRRRDDKSLPMPSRKREAAPRAREAKQ